MKFKLKSIVYYSSLLLICACGNAEEDVFFNPTTGSDLGAGKTVDPCLNLGANQLTLSIQDQFTTMPGKVSIFFKASDTDGNPVPNLKAQEFTIYEQGRNDDCFNKISTSESKARISPNSQIFKNSTLLILDLSNSVLSSSLQELKTASVSFINNVMPEVGNESTKMAIYWFDGEDKLHLLNDLTSTRQDLVTAIERISNTISKDISTDLYGAVIKGTDLATKLINETKNDDIIGAASIVIFTDGTDQASRYTEKAALDKVKNANLNISFFTIGLGSEIDTAVLSSIGKTSSVFTSNKAELETTFNNISFLVSQRANSFYLFEYCSPKRDGSGENNLAIQVISSGKQGAVQTKFKATGFNGSCE